MLLLFVVGVTRTPIVRGSLLDELEELGAGEGR